MKVIKFILKPINMEVWRLVGWESGFKCKLSTLDGAPLISVQTVKSLGIILDDSLSLKAQISNVAKPTFFQLCQARQLAPFLSLLDLATVIQATVTSSLD